jgi:hypothetical protein
VAPRHGDHAPPTQQPPQDRFGKEVVEGEEADVSVAPVGNRRHDAGIEEGDVVRCEQDRPVARDAVEAVDRDIERYANEDVDTRKGQGVEALAAPPVELVSGIRCGPAYAANAS